MAINASDALDALIVPIAMTAMAVLLAEGATIALVALTALTVSAALDVIIAITFRTHLAKTTNIVANSRGRLVMIDIGKHLISN